MKSCLRCGEQIPELKNICDKCRDARKSIYESNIEAPVNKVGTIFDFISISSGVLFLIGIINLPYSKIGSLLFVLSAILLTPFGKSKILGPFMKQAEFKWYQSGFVAFVLFIVCSIIASGTPNKFEPEQEVSQAIANATAEPNPIQEHTQAPAPTKAPVAAITPKPDPAVALAGASPMPGLFGGVDEAKSAWEKELGGKPEIVKWLGIVLDKECDGSPCWRVKAIIRFAGQEGSGYAYMRYGKVLKTKYE